MSRADVSAAGVPYQTGRTVVITGASAGLGAALTSMFARVGADVVLAVRNVAKGERAAEQVRSTHPDASLRVLELDLADLASVRSFADAFTASHDRLDVLINNAGVYGNTTDTTADGFGLAMGVGHLGHFAVTGLLLDRLLDTPGSRVVTVSSSIHKKGAIDLDSFHTPEAGAKGSYANVKLANMLFMAELQRRLEAEASTTSVAAGPPGTKTDGMQTGIASIPVPPLRWLADTVTDAIMLSPEEGNRLAGLAGLTRPMPLHRTHHGVVVNPARTPCRPIGTELEIGINNVHFVLR